MGVKKEFGRGDEELVKVVELKRIKQGDQSMEEFVQDFKRVARDSKYKRQPLIKKIKRGMNGTIRRKLMEAENQPSLIKQWFKRAIALDRNWRESRREKEKLRGKKEQGELLLNNRSKGKYCYDPKYSRGGKRYHLNR